MVSGGDVEGVSAGGQNFSGEDFVERASDPWLISLVSVKWGLMGAQKEL